MLVTLLPEDSGVLVEQLIVGEDVVTVVARLTTPAQPCPTCSHLATQVHSRARRTLQDVPAGVRRVRLSLQVRRFFCRHPACPRRTFQTKQKAIIILRRVVNPVQVGDERAKERTEFEQLVPILTRTR